MLRPEELMAEGLRRYDADDRAGFRALHAHDVVYREPALGIEAHGAEAMCEVVFARKTAFPGLRAEPLRRFAAGDLVCQELVWHARHDGPLTLPGGRLVAPTGREMHTPACLVIRVRDGLVVEMNHYWDAMGLLAALGALEAPVPALAT